MNVRTWIVAGAVPVVLAWLAQPVQAADRIKVAMMDQQQVVERSVAGKRALEDLKVIPRRARRSSIPTTRN